MTHRILCATAMSGVAVLAACSDPEPSSADAGATLTDGAAMAEAPPMGAAEVPDDTAADIAATTGGDGSPLVLTGMHRVDVEGRLQGELRCTFTDGEGQRLLIASANVGEDQPIQALVKIGDYVELLYGQSAGGYDRMVNGTSYAGRGVTAEIARTAEDAQPGEGLTYPATLHVDRADGAARDWGGLWSCGP